jgi:hypothetical protein
VVIDASKNENVKSSYYVCSNKKEDDSVMSVDSSKSLKKITKGYS